MQHNSSNFCLKPSYSEVFRCLSVLISMLPLSATLHAGPPAATCLETFATPKFQALNLREPYGVDYLLAFFAPLKGESCTPDQIETFFNSKHAVTVYRSHNIITFDVTRRKIEFFVTNVATIGFVIKEGTITDIAVGVEGF